MFAENRIDLFIEVITIQEILLMDECMERSIMIKKEMVKLERLHFNLTEYVDVDFISGPVLDTDHGFIVVAVRPATVLCPAVGKGTKIRIKQIRELYIRSIYLIELAKNRFFSYHRSTCMVAYREWQGWKRRGLWIVKL